MKIQIDDLVRDATPEEIATIEAQRTEIAEAIQRNENALKSARNKLSALGFTEAEVKALVG